ncbi:MAG: hypothetical protein GXO62_00900 [Epsilonproteobacteria bacterium]|nr:hypothetical protein [Campylobacterota bacterium]
MAVALKPTFNDTDFVSLFNLFIENVVNDKNLKDFSSLKDLSNKAQMIEDLVKKLNENIENVIDSEDFEKLEDELMEMKVFLELNLDKFPKELRDSLNRLYEALSVFIFNISMFELKNVRDNRN